MKRDIRQTGSMIVWTSVIHDGSSRTRGAVWRDGQAQSRRTEAYLKQYVEGLSDEHARHTKLRLTRRVRSLAAERFLATDFVSSQQRIRDCSRSVHE
jgi:hypothetical protein